MANQQKKKKHFLYALASGHRRVMKKIPVNLII